MKHQQSEWVSDTRRAGRVCSPKVLAQKNRVVGAHRCVWACEEAHHALLCLPPVVTRRKRVREPRCPHNWEAQSRPSLRTAGKLQGVPPSWCGRRVAVSSAVCSRRPQGKRHDVQAACEPGGRGRRGVPVHPTRLQTHRTSPAQALLTILIETLNPTCAWCPCMMSSVHSRSVED